MSGGGRPARVSRGVGRRGAAQRVGGQVGKMGEGKSQLGSRERDWATVWMEGDQVEAWLHASGSSPVARTWIRRRGSGGVEAALGRGAASGKRSLAGLRFRPIGGVAVAGQRSGGSGRAAQWRDAGLGPHEAQSWVASGVLDAREVVEWRRWGFEPCERAWSLGSGGVGCCLRNSTRHARSWRERGFGPEQAARWRAAGFDASTAWNWREAGMEAEEARKWCDAGFEPEPAAQWRKHSFSPEEALRWVSAAFSPQEASAWAKAGMGPKLSAAWRKRGGLTPL
jgi:hypothetical protein